MAAGAPSPLAPTQLRLGRVFSLWDVKRPWRKWDQRGRGVQLPVLFLAMAVISLELCDPGFRG